LNITIKLALQNYVTSLHIPQLVAHSQFLEHENDFGLTVQCSIRGIYKKKSTKRKIENAAVGLTAQNQRHNPSLTVCPAPTTTCSNFSFFNPIQNTLLDVE